MSDEDFGTIADSNNFNSSNFIQASDKTEQQPIQDSIERNGAGDANSVEQSTSIISLARPEDDARKIFVGGLSWDTTTKELKNYFSQYGTVEETLIKQDPVTGRSRGFGFVLFENENSVIEATDPGKKHTILGKHIDPKAAKSKNKKDPITKIFVGGLDPELTLESIKEFFEGYGKVEQIDLPHDKTTNKRRAFAFVSFESESAVAAVTATSKITIQGKEVDVKKATPHHQQLVYRSRGGGSGMRGGYGMAGRGNSYQMNNWNEWNPANYAYGYNQSNYGLYDFQNNYGNTNYPTDYSRFGYTNQGGWSGPAYSNGNYGVAYNQSQNSTSNYNGSGSGNAQRQWTTRS